MRSIIGRSTLTFLVLLLATTAALAGKMGRSGIESVLLGQSVRGEYSDGREFTEFFGSDMTSRYTEDGRTTAGTVRFEGNLMCFTYAGEALSGGCFEVWRRSDNCFDFYGATEGVASASLRQRREGTGWTARTWRRDAPSTCVGDQIALLRSR